MRHERWLRVKIRNGSYGIEARGRWFSLLTTEGRAVGFMVRLPGAKRWHGVLDKRRAVRE